MDAALAELGRAQGRLAALEGRQAAAQASFAAQWAERRRGPEARRLELEAALERFCRRHKPALDRVNGHERRSRKLLFGRVGYRASQAVTIQDEAEALRALASWRAGRQFLRVRTELDKEALRDFLAGNGNGRAAHTRRRLRRNGIGLERREHWFYEIDRGAFERWG